MAPDHRLTLPLDDDRFVRAHCRDFLHALTTSRRSEVLQAVDIRVRERLPAPERELLGYDAAR
ncbi:hypothetical protein ACFV4P_23415 [Kitasatospora sp. NPDC059795]|uniref:hypothetical protein n=1 Tax=Kitasatospora sp. NPDC059795 TaxID=3346949 RepID=UPI00364F4B10